MRNTHFLNRPGRWRPPVIGVVALLSGAVLALAAPKKVLVVTVTKGFRHSSIPTAEKVLGQLAQKDGNFTVDYVRTDDDLASKMSVAALAGCDGVIFANTTGDLPLPDVAGFLRWIEDGKGFIGMHSATDTFRGHKPLHPYTVMINGEFKTHKEQAAVVAFNSDPDFPSNRHLGPTYEVFDEIYILNGYERKAAHALLDLDQHPNTRMPGHYPIAWARAYGTGRVWYTSLGHREDVWESSPYQKHVLGGIRWALGLESGDATPQSVGARLSEQEAAEGFKLLFNGEDLTGWQLRHAGGKASWSAQNGMLVNELPEGGHGTDLVSQDQYRDFTLRYQYLIPKGANSGVYLRGRYEVQIFDDHGTGKTEPGGNGAIYSIKPASENASRPPGQWQEAEATLRGNRITVVLNGVKIQDNLEVTRPTGGQLDDQLNKPGPIMFQGDHGAVAFRNVRIKPL